MLNLSTLDILIAMVIVILVLSLVVQSIQTLTKKVLKIKSRSILASLEDLFETIVNRPANAVAAGTASKTPELVAHVTATLKDMGRKTLFGNAMLDSLAKSDLLKILTRVKAADLLPDTVDKFQTVLTGFNALKAELGRIDTTLLPGDASAKFAAMQGSLMPLLHDLEALAGQGTIDPAVFFGDLYKLRQIKAAEVLEILGQIQQAVGQDLIAMHRASDETRRALADARRTGDEAGVTEAARRDADGSARHAALKSVDAGLKTIASQIAALSTSFDAAFAPLFARLQQVDAWYDTVMQGFEERYARHMRTVALLISIGVVVTLNANFFSIYRAIKSDPAMTKAIVDQSEKVVATAQQAAANQGGAAASTPPATPAASTSPASTPSPPATTDAPSAVAEVKKEQEKLKGLVETYESFGITPLSRQQIIDAWNGQYSWRQLNETFFGWAIMVMLLTAGAPFWQDTLESLFGLKNLLRQKSGTKNIEEDKGGPSKP